MSYREWSVSDDTSFAMSDCVASFTANSTCSLRDLSNSSDDTVLVRFDDTSSTITVNLSPSRTNSSPNSSSIIRCLNVLYI
ncbi:hypothetical protein PGB90_003770 [Kerria lacca]